MTHGEQPNGPVGRRRRTRPAPGPAGDVRGVVGQVPYAVVFTGVIGGLVVSWFDFKAGAFLIAGSLLVGAVLRGVLTESRLGLLASRKRLTDVAIMAFLGAGLAFVAWRTSGG